MEVRDEIIIIFQVPKVAFFKGTHPCQHDNSKAIRDINKQFFVYSFTCLHDFCATSWSETRFQNEFKGTTPIHDDYGKIIDVIEKKFFAFNCQLKKLNEEI